MSRIFTYEDNCTGCNKCIEACPVDCANEAYLTPSGARKIRVNGDYCIHCGACMSACPEKAISIQAGKILLKGPEIPAPVGRKAG